MSSRSDSWPPSEHGREDPGSDPALPPAQLLVLGVGVAQSEGGIKHLPLLLTPGPLTLLRVGQEKPEKHRLGGAHNSRGTQGRAGPAARGRGGPGQGGGSHEEGRGKALPSHRATPVCGWGVTRHR